MRKSYGESEGRGRDGAARWTWSVALNGGARGAAVMPATFRHVLYFLMNSMSKAMAISSPITPGYLVMPKSERWMVAVAEAPRR